MKKIIFVIFVLMAITAYGLSLSNPKPNGDVLNGTSYTFVIESDTNMTNGSVIIHNSTANMSYPLNCIQKVCFETINLSSFPEGNYTHNFFVDGNLSSTYNFSIFRNITYDTTPPSEPIVTPASGTILGTITPNISITYPDVQNVTLKIFSGQSLVKDFIEQGLNFSWHPLFESNTTYYFTLSATDPYGNQRNTSYVITTTVNDINVSVIDTVHITTSANAVISSAFPGQYILIRYSVSMYGGTGSVRARMSDLTSPNDVIDISSETSPYLFCQQDYNSNKKDVNSNQSKVYHVLNYYNETEGNALQCNGNTSAIVDYDIFLKVPIPAGTKSGTFTSTVQIGMY